MAEARLGQFSYDPTTGILKQRIDALESALIFVLMEIRNQGVSGTTAARIGEHLTAIQDAKTQDD